MSAIAINLLPGDTVLKRKDQEKITKVQLASTAAILILLFLASTTLALRILQNQSIKQAKEEAQLAEETVVSFKEKESALTFLKNRLNIISQITKTPSKQTAVYQLVNSLIPSSVGITSISVNRSEQVLISVLVPNSFALGDLLTNLTDEAAFESIAKVEIESLSRSRDGSYRGNLKVIPR